jgi:hypothetical protein
MVVSLFDSRALGLRVCRSMVWESAMVAGRFLIVFIVILAGLWAPVLAAPEVLDAYYRADTPFPEFLRFWSDSSPAKGGDSAKRPLGGSLHVYVRNTGAQALRIEDVLLDGISLKQAIAYSDQRKFKKVAYAAGIYFSRLQKPDMDRLIALGEPIWYKIDPESIEPGGTGEVIVRLRRDPDSPSVKVTVVDETDRTDVIVRPGTKPPRIESIGFPTGLQSVCLYFRGTNPGKVPVKVMMDGQDVTTLSRIASDPRLDMSPVVVKLRAPLARGSFHCFQGIYADGSRATAGIRAFHDEMGYGLWGARPGSEAEPNIGREHVLDMGVHNINVQMPILGSGAAAKFMGSAEGKKLMRDLGIRRLLDEPGKGEDRFAFYLADEPDTADFRVKGTPPQSKIGCLGQGLLKHAAELRKVDPLTPNMVNVNMTFKPENWYIYGQLPDYFAADPYYQTRLAEAYWSKPSTVPTYSKCTFVHAVASVCNSACAPKPLHIMLNSVRSQKKDHVFRWGTRKEKRIELFYALAAGAKQISYWWFLPIGPNAEGANGCGADHPQAKALWNEIGLLGAEVRTVGPIITTSCPIALETNTSAKMWVRSLVAGTDTVLILCVNDDYINDEKGTNIKPIENVQVSVVLPTWIQPKSVFEIDYTGIHDVKHDVTADLKLQLGTVNVTRMIAVTSDTSLRERLQKRYTEKFASNVEALLRH